MFYEDIFVLNNVQIMQWSTSVNKQYKTQYESTCFCDKD